MKFVSITGPKDDFDNFVNNYLNKYDIHLEDALTELSSAHDLRPFTETNPYRDTLSQANELIEYINSSTPTSKKQITPAEAEDIIISTLSSIKDLNAENKRLKEVKDDFRDLMDRIENFRQLDFDIRKLLEFKFIKFRFGRIPNDYYKKFLKYAYNSINTLFLESNKDAEYVWGVYFVPETYVERVDAVFTSLHFERTNINGGNHELIGDTKTPEIAFDEAKKGFEETADKIKDISNQIQNIIKKHTNDVLAAIEVLSSFNNTFDVRKKAALTKAKSHETNYFFLCGWLKEEDLDSFLNDIKIEKNLECIVEDDDIGSSKPPTKLSNSKLVRPFEMFIRLYGLPAYHELDPTWFVALTYPLIFGMMFGDVGQGLLLTIGGAIIYRLKKSDLAAIISLAGVISTLFGFAYGAFFGYEDIIPRLWLNPMENVMDVLIYSIGFGVVLIMLTMVLNIINGIREKNIEKIFFDTNGVSGLVFYGTAIASILLFVNDKPLMATTILIIFFGVPLLLILLRTPLMNLIKKKPEILPEGGMYFVEGIFGLIEVLLSYITNTVSFLRIGAFAMMHAAMMSVVMLLAGAGNGSGNLIVIILGNILVIALEGLVVGIQVLRLEYYEMFSRFYSGTGKEFQPFQSNNVESK